MKLFSQLFNRVDSTTSTNEKIDALIEFFQKAAPEDAIWTIALFSHKKPKRTISSSLLRKWAIEQSKLPPWLFEDTYHIVGDLAETIALSLPPHSEDSQLTLSGWIGEMLFLRNAAIEEKKTFLLKAWRTLPKDQCFLFNKLITGGFRIGISSRLIIKSLAKITGITEDTLTHRLTGNWNPATTSFHDLILSEKINEGASKPYPFYLAYALDEAPENLGIPSDWQAEWKWDGIRGLMIYRNDDLYIWSRGEELVTEKFPEFQSLKQVGLPDFVLDGEIIGYKDNIILPFQNLQTRIGRKNVTVKILYDCPAVMIIYDVLEWQSKDIRHHTLSYRRKVLEEFIELQLHSSPLLISPTIRFNHWDELVEIRNQARKKMAEGIMLKRMDSLYGVGRKKGDWWKWKADPLSIDAVMIYAQRGHGRRANLFSDFTFAVWTDDQTLIPVTKAYSGLTDIEFTEISNWVRKNTIERFGPVHAVPPVHVFEIAFEGISASARHKSGVALRFPRIKKWRHDKTPDMADHLNTLFDMLKNFK